MARSQLQPPPRLMTRSLREQVYEYLRGAMSRGEIVPGEVLDLKAIGRGLGISRTPLREALLQLETEGFVSILPRRGCMVRGLTRQGIRNIYQMLGALESAVIWEVHPAVGSEITARMRSLNTEMRRALERDDFSAYYEANLAFHDSYLDLSSNKELLHLARVLKQRLYDFPRRRAFVREWEEASVLEHDELVVRMEDPDPRRAADYIRDVHWSFLVQERFIRKYYGGSSGEGEHPK